MPKLPEKIDDWLAPWETATGENEIDKDKLKRYLFNLLGDKEKLQERVSGAEKERDELKTQVDAKAREGESEVDKLKRELAEAQKGAPKGDDLEVTKLRVALKKGLKEGDVKRLIGANEAELLADADELLKSFGQGGKTDNEGDNGGGGNEGANDARRTPKGTSNPGDPKPEGGADVTLEKAMDLIPRIR